MALSKQPYKGARDFYPEDKRTQNYMFDVWRKVAKRYGYEEYDAPILEPTDLYLAKGNQEIIDEQTYTFEDRGKRSVTIRTEMTPTVSRMVAARRQELSYPVRWFSIPNLWRYERPQRGRLREFWQLNVDIFGVVDIAAELEILTLVDDIFKEFGATRAMYGISVNSRGLINYILTDYLGLDDKQQRTVSGLIDRMNKMERTKFIAAIDELLSEKQRSDSITEKLLGVLDARAISDLPEAARDTVAAKELEALIKDLREAGIDNVAFDGTLMRGFDYYTGVIFEVFDTNPDNNRAMLGGGRYDGLVGMFGVEPVPTVGFGWGDVTLENFLRTHALMPADRSDVDIYVALAGVSLPEAAKVITELRTSGLNVAVDLSGKKLGAQLKTADKRGIANVLVIGSTELSQGVYELKNMQSGESTKLALKDIAKEVVNAK